MRRVVRVVLGFCLKAVGLAFLCELLYSLWLREGAGHVEVLENAVNRSLYLLHSLQLQEFTFAKLLRFTFLHHFYYLILILVLLIYYNKYRENLAHRPTYTLTPMVPLEEFPKKVGEETASELAKLLVHPDYELWKRGLLPGPSK